MDEDSLFIYGILNQIRSTASIFNISGPGRAVGFSLELWSDFNPGSHVRTTARPHNIRGDWSWKYFLLAAD